MAHFQGALKFEDKPLVTRQGGKQQPGRASLDASNIGGTVRIQYSMTRECNTVTFDLDGGTQGSERIRIADATRDKGWGSPIVLVPHIELLRETSDENWGVIFQDYPDIAKRLAALLFANMDAVQRG